jgi:hypothetical protein
MQQDVYAAIGSGRRRDFGDRGLDSSFPRCVYVSKLNFYPGLLQIRGQRIDRALALCSVEMDSENVVAAAREGSRRGRTEGARNT